MASEPCARNHHLADHVERLLVSLRHWTGRNLVPPDLSLAEQARELFHAPFVVLSHANQADPLLNYANQAGLQLFELTWDELISMPSRRTAEPLHRAERDILLGTVSRQGFIDDYRGIRISKSGRRFLIERAIVWNVLDANGVKCGQAATFWQWKILP
jgi:hypothetical protein